MCGILGWSGQSNSFSREVFISALGEIAHRGPDGDGVYFSDNFAFGHRRLSIIDLSDGGSQPMRSPLDGCNIVFNGEIYNYLELKAELEKENIKILGGSDTGVLLAAMGHWGVRALPKLNGMWAFAYWDAREKVIILSRDRFGVKPLYYRIGTDGIAFGSEPKALLKIYPECRKIDEDVLGKFLINNQAHSAGNSFYSEIKIFPAASYGIFNPYNGSFRIQRFWDYPDSEFRQSEGAEVHERFEHLLEDAVRIRLRSDVPVGLTLSGGLDSTSILTAAYKVNGKALTSFTSVYDDEKHSGEMNWAETAVAPYAGNVEPVSASRREWLETLRLISWHMDSPGYSPAVYPLWCLMKKARRDNFPVVLEGQGADEALGGYPQYQAIELLQWLRGGSDETRSVRGFVDRFRRMSGSVTAKWALAWIVRELFPQAVNFHRDRSGIGRQNEYGADESRRILSSDKLVDRLRSDHQTRILPALLQYGDAVSMAHSVESRNPYLDYRLVDFMFKLKDSFRIRNGESKWILRNYLRTNGQELIGNRMDKRGYPTPVDHWIRRDSAQDVFKLLLHGDKYIHSWCEPKRIIRLLEKHERGAMAVGHHLYKLISAQIWYEECIQGRRP